MAIFHWKQRLLSDENGFRKHYFVVCSSSQFDLKFCRLIKDLQCNSLFAIMYS